MTQYHLNIIIIVFSVTGFLALFTYGLNLNFGLGQIVLLIAGGYGIYLNLREIKNTWEH
ncbi:hypothetical protein GCM10028778_16320 [Barrientosiimonas marina]